MGILRWVEESLSQTNYIKVMTDATPLHVVLLDEVCREQVLQKPFYLVRDSVPVSTSENHPVFVYLK